MARKPVDPLERRIDMLLSVPVGGWVSTAEVLHALQGLGHDATHRMVHDDLMQMAGKFGLRCEQPAPSTPRRWSRRSPLE